MSETKQTSKERAALFIKAAFEALDAAGGSLPPREVKREVADRVALTERDKALYEKTGNVRWQAQLHFASIDCVKAGFLIKHQGLWTLTPEGKAVMNLPADQLLERAMRAYREWVAAQPDRNRDEPSMSPHLGPAGEAISAASERSFVLETAEDQASAEIATYVNGRSPYEFQEMVAALLRGMGYATRFEAARGPDGGTDVLAYSDPIGAKLRTSAFR